MKLETINYATLAYVVWLQAFTPERLEQNHFPQRHEFTSALRGGKNQFKDDAEYQDFKKMVGEKYNARTFFSLLFVYAIADVEVRP